MSQIISRTSAAECNLTIKKNHLLLSGAIYSYFFFNNQLYQQSSGFCRIRTAADMPTVDYYQVASE